MRWKHKPAWGSCPTTGEILQQTANPVSGQPRGAAAQRRLCPCLGLVSAPLKSALKPAGNTTTTGEADVSPCRRLDPGAGTDARPRQHANHRQRRAIRLPHPARCHGTVLGCVLPSVLPGLQKCNSQHPGDPFQRLTDTCITFLLNVQQRKRKGGLREDPTDCSGCHRHAIQSPAGQAGSSSGWQWSVTVKRKRPTTGAM